MSNFTLSLVRHSWTTIGTFVVHCTLSMSIVRYYSSSKWSKSFQLDIQQLRENCNSTGLREPMLLREPSIDSQNIGLLSWSCSLQMHLARSLLNFQYAFIKVASDIGFDSQSEELTISNQKNVFIWYLNIMEAMVPLPMENGPSSAYKYRKPQPKSSFHETPTTSFRFPHDSITVVGRTKVKALLRQNFDGISRSPSTSVSPLAGCDGSIMSTTDPSYNRHRLCAFCHLGMNSQLGQGELMEHRVDSPTMRMVLGNEHADQQRTSMIQVDDISSVGLPDDCTLADVFDREIQTLWIHSWCNYWTDVPPQSRSLLQSVKSALTVHCSGCSRFGASIHCSRIDCPFVYHLPCAFAFGGLFDRPSRLFLCPEHAPLVVNLSPMPFKCELCSLLDSIANLLFCTSCASHHHGECLRPKVAVSAKVRVGWQCPSCKTCQQCKSGGDDRRMLVCDGCDKACHIYCTQPPLVSVPKHGWKCKLCHRCSNCGGTSNSRWHLNGSVCDSCYQQRNAGRRRCVVCGRPCRSLKQLASCCQCNKPVHPDCDPSPSHALSHYLCPVCRRPPSRSPPSPSSSPCSSSASPSTVDEQEELAKFMQTEIGGLSAESSPLAGFIHHDLADLTPFQHCYPPSSINDDGSQECRVPNAPPPLARKHGHISRKKPAARSMTGSVRTRSSGCTGDGNIGRNLWSGRRRGRPTASVNSTRSTDQDSVDTDESRHRNDDNDYIRTVVVTNVRDRVVSEQPLCLVCGSLGKDDEATMVCCMSCAQSYHSYCVNIHEKLNMTLLNRGWRCLDCTVCEGCGEGRDESQLLLCDDCDVSYHIYCLDPALDRIPAGPWRCTWCSKCRRCSKQIEVDTATTGGKTEGLCRQCRSLSRCPKCAVDYQLGQAIIKCLNCLLWFHGKCEELYTEEMLELAAERSFRCSNCRPIDTNSLSSSSLSSGDNGCTLNEFNIESIGNDWIE